MELIDWNQFNEIVDFDDPECVEIFDDFAAEVPGQLRELKEACARGEHDEAVRLAHRLRGGCSTFGFNGIASLLQNLESAAKEGSSIDPNSWYAATLGAFDGASRDVAERRPSK